MYTPDRYVVVHVTTPEEDFYRLFCTWIGGYTGSDAWRLNSGINTVVVNDNSTYTVKGSSSTLYTVSNNVGLSAYSANILSQMMLNTPDGYKITVIRDFNDIQKILNQFIKDDNDTTSKSAGNC